MIIHPRCRPGRYVLSTCLFVLVAAAVTASSPSSSSAASSAPPGAPADGQHDFDWEIGTWDTSVRVLADPLSDTEDEWLQFTGTSVVRPLVGRRANIVELQVSGPAGAINGLNLRLYKPQAKRWSSTFANLRDGMLTPSVFGAFHQGDGASPGVGEFHGDDELAGRPIKVRFLVIRQGPDRARFEQAFSDDGGRTWETNWIAVDRRVKPLD